MNSTDQKTTAPRFSLARLIAWEVLNETATPAAWVEDLLRKRLAGSGLSHLDERLCRELAFGVVKARRYLDFTLQPLFKQRAPTGKLQNLLRLGIYQLFCLDKIPAHAVLHESVEMAKARLPRGQDKFVNAVLREAVRRGAPPLPDSRNQPVEHYAVRYSLPSYLAERWLARFGEAAASAMMDAAQVAPPLVARVNRLRSTEEAVIAALAQPGLRAEKLEWPQAVQILAATDPAQLPGYAEGFFYFQDQGSQSLGYIINPQPGQLCLDLCSAPGGKATHLAELMDDQGQVLAYDVNLAKRQRVAANAQRLGLASVRVLDVLPLELTADRVLVDAPCSGLGTLRRHAEIRWRVQPADFQRLARQQLALLRQGAGFVKPGGHLIYSTCSTEPEENEQVVADFLKGHPEFQLAPGPGRDGLPGAEYWEADGFFRTFPRHPEMDGMFAARMIRR